MLAILIAYPLSYGPLIFLSRVIILPTWLTYPIDDFYWPIRLVCHKFPALDEAYFWYLERWEIWGGNLRYALYGYEEHPVKKSRW